MLLEVSGSVLCKTINFIWRFWHFGNIDADGDLDVDGHLNSRVKDVTGVYLCGTPQSELDVLGKQMSVSGVSTFVGVTTFSADVSVGVDTSVGVILTSPNGTPYRLVVANDGTLSTAAV